MRRLDWTRWRERITSTLPLLLVVVVAGATALPLATVQLSRHDHPTHLLKAWQFYTEMLTQGRLGGYNHHWAFGYPVSDITPSGGEVWIALFRVATFGTLSWEATYKLAFAGLLVFTGLASYAFAKRYFGRVTAALAAVLAVLDPGALYQGGWEWNVTFGVWPVTLSCCCVLMALAKPEDILAGPTRRHVILAGLWMAAALWAHQLSLVLLALALPLLLLEHWTRGPGDLLPAWLRVGASYATGFGLTACLLVPLFARTHLTFDRGAIGASVPQWASRLVELRLFENNWPLITAFGLVGGLQALLTRRRGAVFLTVACAACLLLATDITFSFFRAERIVPGLVKLESGRMIMGCKLFWFPLAAYGAAWAFVGRGGTLSLVSPARRIARWLVVIALAVPFLVPAGERVYEAYLHKTYATEFPAELAADFAKLNRWALAERERSPDFYRIAYSARRLELWQTLTPMLSHTPAYMVGGTSAQQFSVFPCALDPGLLTALSVRYVVSDTPLSDPVYLPERAFGVLRVYRFRDYRKERFTIVGQGQGELLTFSPDLIRVRMSGVGAATRLKLHVARYDRWEAVQDHRTLPISAATVYGHEYPVLMEVPVNDGVVEFRYVRRAVDWIGLAFSLLTALIVAVSALAPRRWRPRWSLTDVVRRYSAALRWVVLAAIGAAGLVMALRCRTREHLLPASSIFHRVEGQDLRVRGKACLKEGPLTFACGPHSVRAEYTRGSWGAHLCMTTEERGGLTVSVATKLGAALQVYTDTLAEGGSVKVMVDGEHLGTVMTRRSDTDFRILQFDTQRFANQSSADVQIELNGAALRCFDVRVVP